MGSQYKCQICLDSEDFNVYSDVYCDEIIPFNHFEIVCKNCGYGFVLPNKDNNQTRPHIKFGVKKKDFIVSEVKEDDA